MFSRKKAPGEMCPACDRRISTGQKVCECGTATIFMTFDERREWEVGQWRKTRLTGMSA